MHHYFLLYYGIGKLEVIEDKFQFMHFSILENTPYIKNVFLSLLLYLELFSVCGSVSLNMGSVLTSSTTFMAVFIAVTSLNDKLVLTNWMGQSHFFLLPHTC